MYPPPEGPYIKNETQLSYSKEEQAVNDALMTAMMVPRESLQAHGAAQPVPRFGYEKRELGIYDVLGTGRSGGPDRRMDYSGSYGSYSGTQRPGLGMV